MEETPPSPRDGPHQLLWVLVAVAAALTVLLGALFVYLHWRSSPATISRNQPAGEPLAADTVVIEDAPAVNASAPGDFSTSKAVTSLLGEDESGHGLVHLGKQSDGPTTIESIHGVPARVARLKDAKTEVYFYFQIHPTFKQQDLRRVRIDVEYLAPQAGTMNIHYDALKETNIKNPVYRDAMSNVRLAVSENWQKATFRTRNDAEFHNRQNGKADFRIYAKTPVLYVRRVTVTLEPSVEESSPFDFSTSNEVSIVLGQEKLEDGLRYIADERDGLTDVVNLDGVTCRHLGLAAEGRFFGSFYFAISPSFKRGGLSNARVEVEYLARQSNSFRVQFDGIQGGTNRSYVAVVPVGASVVRRYGNEFHALTPSLGTWSVATFHITNATFRNSQNGGADFRFEVIPPDMYVRRVTLAREKGPAAPAP